jgi:hypothetical protein
MAHLVAMVLMGQVEMGLHSRVSLTVQNGSLQVESLVQMHQMGPAVVVVVLVLVLKVLVQVVKSMLVVLVVVVVLVVALVLVVCPELVVVHPLPFL